MSSHVGRNDACPCGSGKKYKKCCLGTEANSQPELDNWRFPAARDELLDPSRTDPPDPLDVIQDALGLMKDEFPPLSDGTDDWFDEFYLAEPGEKIALLRKLVAEDRPIEDYEAMDFADLALAPAVWTDDAVRADYIAFVLDLYDDRPELFRLGAGWLVREVALDHLSSSREHDVLRLILPLIDSPDLLSDETYDLLDILRLGNVPDAARRLTFSIVSRLRAEPDAQWGDNLKAHQIFACDHLYRDAIDAGNSSTAVAELRRGLREIGADPTTPYFEATLAHRAGDIERVFRYDEIDEDEEPFEFNRFLLMFDFGYWLTQQRGIPPLSADALLGLVRDGLYEMNHGRDHAFSVDLDRLKNCLLSMTQSLTMQETRGIATLIGLEHFCDFLLAHDLIDVKEHKRSRQCCEKAWKFIEATSGKLSEEYAFLDRLRCRGDKADVSGGE